MNVNRPFFRKISNVLDDIIDILGVGYRKPRSFQPKRLGDEWGQLLKVANYPTDEFDRIWET